MAAEPERDARGGFYDSEGSYWAADGTSWGADGSFYDASGNKAEPRGVYGPDGSYFDEQGVKTLAPPGEEAYTGLDAQQDQQQVQQTYEAEAEATMPPQAPPPPPPALPAQRAPIQRQQLPQVRGVPQQQQQQQQQQEYLDYGVSAGPSRVPTAVPPMGGGGGRSRRASSSSDFPFSPGEEARHRRVSRDQSLVWEDAPEEGDEGSILGDAEDWEAFQRERRRQQQQQQQRLLPHHPAASRHMGGGRQLAAAHQHHHHHPPLPRQKSLSPQDLQIANITVATQRNSAAAVDLANQNAELRERLAALEGQASYLNLILKQQLTNTNLRREREVGTHLALRGSGGARGGGGAGGRGAPLLSPAPVKLSPKAAAAAATLGLSPSAAQREYQKMLARSIASLEALTEDAGVDLDGGALLRSMAQQQAQQQQQAQKQQHLELQFQQFQQFQQLQQQQSMAAMNGLGGFAGLSPGRPPSLLLPPMQQYPQAAAAFPTALVSGSSLQPQQQPFLGAGLMMQPRSVGMLSPLSPLSPVMLPTSTHLSVSSLPPLSPMGSAAGAVGGFPALASPGRVIGGVFSPMPQPAKPPPMAMPAPTAAPQQRPTIIING
jgi:hypothetical protein